MIVVDESIDNASVLQAIADWYPGRVVSIRSLRPDTLIQDETIPTLLHQAKQLTFVTINVDDFWKKAPANRNYCIIALELEQGQALQLPLLIRRHIAPAGVSDKSSPHGENHSRTVNAH